MNVVRTRKRLENQDDKISVKDKNKKLDFRY